MQRAVVVVCTQTVITWTRGSVGDARIRKWTARFSLPALTKEKSDSRSTKKTR